VSVVVDNGVRLLRAYGLSDHPNILGGCLAFGLVIIIAAYLHVLRPLPILTAIVTAFPALAVTFSRAAWLAFVGGLVFIVALDLIARNWESIRRLGWLALMCAFLLAPLLIAYSRFFGVRLNANNSFNTPSVEQQSIGERILLINYALPILVDHPFFGVGLGASPNALKVYYPGFPVTYEPPHFAVFDSALETGLLGAVFYLALIFSPFVFFFKHRKSLLSNRLTSTAAALLLSITIVGLFDYYTWLLVPGRLWQWLAWGLWAAALQLFMDQPSHLSQVPIPANA
jgi:O-antigen ligase